MKRMHAVTLVAGGLALLAASVGCLPNLPVASPDGQFLAMALTPDGELETQPTRATGTARDLYISWNDPTDEAAPVWRVTDFSSATRTVTVGFPAWSRSQDRIAFVARRIEGGERVESLYVVKNARNALARSALASGTTFGWRVAAGATEGWAVAMPELRSLRDPAQANTAIRRVHLARGTGTHISFPALSPSGRYVAWIELADDALPTPDTRTAIANSYAGRLHIHDVETGEPVALPEPVESAVPSIAWVDENTLVVAQSTGPAAEGAPGPATKSGRILRVSVPHTETVRRSPAPDEGAGADAEGAAGRMEGEIDRMQAPQVIDHPGGVEPIWSGWISQHHVGLAARADGAIVFDQIDIHPTNRYTNSRVWLLLPGAAEPTLLAGEGFVHSPRFVESPAGPSVRWAHETARHNAQSWSLASAGVLVARNATDGPGAAVPTYAAPVAEGVSRGIFYPLTGLIPGGGATLSVVTGRVGERATNAPRLFDGSAGYDGNVLLTAVPDPDGEPDESGARPAALTPQMPSIVNGINRYAPDTGRLLQAARRSIGVDRVAIQDSTLMFEVTVADRDEETGEVVYRQGQYREFVRGDSIRTEETFAGTLIRTWDGRVAGSQSGDGAFRPNQDPQSPREFEAREIAQDLGAKLRWHRLLFLQNVERPGPTEQAYADAFELHAFRSLPIREAGDGPVRQLVYLRRTSRYLPFDDGDPRLPDVVRSETIYIGLEIVRRDDGSVEVLPREIRARNTWIDNNPAGGEDGEDGQQVRQSVMRFPGEYLAVGTGRNQIRLPGRIVGYNGSALPPLPNVALDTSEGNQVFRATLLRQITGYPYSPRHSGRLPSGVNLGISDAAFAALQW